MAAAGTRGVQFRRHEPMDITSFTGTTTVGPICAISSRSADFITAVSTKVDF
jgi:hypothetical protein